MVRAEARAVEEFAVGLFLDDEAVEVVRRVGEVAQPFAIGAIHLHAGFRIHDAHVGLALGADGDVAVLVAHLRAAFGEFEPVGSDLPISGDGVAQKGGEGESSEDVFVHGNDGSS